MKKVLILGDSHTVGAPGKVLKERLEGAGAEVTVFGKVGRSAASFLDGGGTVPGGYDTIIIVLGTNDALRGFVATQDATRKLRSQAEATGAVVYQVGPPHFYRDDLEEGAKKVRTLQASLYGDRFIDSFPMTERSLDGRTAKDHGVHFTEVGAERWMNPVVDQLLRPRGASGGIGLFVALAVAFVVGRALLR